MNPRSIYSKSGKGVQEASGKTSLLKRAERAVLSAIDGRATLAEVAQKVGKPFDGAFQALIVQLDKDGFVREVAAAGGGTSTNSQRTAATRPPAPRAAAAPPAAGEDLDFTSILSKPRPASTPASGDDTRAKAQEAALYKAREEAEARAQAERERLRQEIEAKARAEAEAKIRAETEKRLREEAAAKQKSEAQAKARAEAEALAKAAREAAARAAAEAKAKAEAEARAKIEAERKAREEAERARVEAERRAREEAERARAEAERVRREAEELRQRLEEERKAREEAERVRREEEERRRREEAERRAREEAERRAREEAERRAREEAERQAREEAERQAREEAERQAREEAERARRATEETRVQQAALVAAPPAAPDPEATSLDALMADLDSFSRREEQEREQREAAVREEKARHAEEAERRAREETERRAREETERRAREEAERRSREEAERVRREMELQQRQEEEERRASEEAARRAREEAEDAAERERLEAARRLEAEERVRKAREAAAAAAAAASMAPPTAEASATAARSDDIGVTEEDLDLDDIQRDAKIEKQSRKAQREREREQRKREREREKEQRKREARERAQAAKQASARRGPRRPVRWGRPLAMTLFVVLVLGIGALHVVPLPMAEYEQAASAALGRPVRIDAGRLSLVGGVHLNLQGVRVGEHLRIAEVRAYPQLGALLEERKAFKRVELDRLVLAQDTLAEALFGRAAAPGFGIASVVVRQLRLNGPLALPPLEVEAALGTDGAVRSVRLRGPDELAAILTPSGAEVHFDVTASSFTVPFAPQLTLHSFAMKGLATRQSLRITEWGGALYDGALSGVANVAWSGNWEVNGAVTVRNINAAVFAPALLSEGKAEGSGKFTMVGVDPGKLASGARLEGNFTVYKGVLGSFDLSRLIQSGGRQHAGRTQFIELKAQGIYDGGAVALRDVAITAGALHAGANADIAQNGALSGRIVADVRTSAHTLRQIIVLGGTVKEPQVRN